MNLTQGTNREHLSPEQVRTLRASGVLLEDLRRERPRWFDGRFLTARDLIREQQYFLTREADLGQAAGSGVATGLAVSEAGDPQSLSIAAGHGITPSGQLVLLEREVAVRLTDIPIAEQLSAKFGLGRLPAPPAVSRTGLFVLALRPVEFTANPVGAYPTSLTGQRIVEDGDVIEATAIVLVPWNDDGAADALEIRRSRAARAIFVDGTDRGVSANLLPLAMLALSANSLVWIDAPLVRRELGADRADLPGLGFAPRALRLAHLLQHQEQLADIVATANGRGFPAAAKFAALPPAGPLPPGVVNPADFTQSYFPVEVDVDFSIIPEDELSALVEEALALPPIDLEAASETLESTAVLVVAPVPRSQWRAVVARLNSLTRAVKPAAPNLVAARKPLEILQRLRLPPVALTPLDASSPSDAEWQRLARLDNLWFVRRRNLAYREDVTGTAVRLAGREIANEADIIGRMTALGLQDRFTRLTERATPAARAELANLLSSPRFVDSPALTAVALGEFSRSETLDQAAALRAAATVTAANTGSGLNRLEAATDITANSEALVRLADDAEWRTLDSQASTARLEEVPQLAARTGARLTGPAGISRTTPGTTATPIRRTPSGPTGEPQ
ncbi:hypothetical protein [Methylococcus sp. EFPC2]|uniref:hypothetical protein n=1 Tax=Methylococcus sp. EFPC2 TaxID=2812648 RepID=UPI001966D195|nr:hypothetical protein [Methylococcus sp. EFPC2]QSA98405.1 hypothetical protein JWZ97_06245 [Methylococcus sp. EFPC2]